MLQQSAALDNYNNYTNFQIPLEKLCSLEVRELLEQGTPRGSGHNESAIKIAKELIGVESYCKAKGIGYQGTAEELYKQFLVVSGIDSDGLTESRWKSAIAANPSPSLSPDKIETCLNAWYRQNGSNYSPRPHAPKAKPKAKGLSLPPIEGPVTLAKFEVIPTDFPQPSKPSFIPNGIPENATQTTYRYGSTQFIKRLDWEDPSKPNGRDKTFRQCFVNAEGELTWGKGSDPWPLYRESEVTAANGWVLLQEGEKTTEAGRELGIIGTTLQGSNWSEDAIAAALTRPKEAGLQGLVFITDNDHAGETKGKKVLSASAKTSLPVIVIPITQLWPDAPEKGDLADWITWGTNNGMNTGDFIERIEAEIHKAVNERQAQQNQDLQPVELSKTEEVKLKIKLWLEESDVTAKIIQKSEICSHYRISDKAFDAIAATLDENSSKPKAKIYDPAEFMALPTAGSLLLAPGIAGSGVTIVGGSGGVGKTTLAYHLAGAVIMRDEFLGEVPTRQGSVLFVSSDEPHAFAQDKLINRGITHGYKMMIDWDVSQWSDLEMTVEDMRPALVIVDSFNAIHNDDNFDENSTQASQTVKKLERLSVKCSVPIVLIHHLGKSKDNKGVNKLRGNTAIAASCSSVLILETIEGTAKSLTQPKIRGSEPLNLIVKMDVENGRFEVTEGNVADDATKSLAQRLKDFFTANPGCFFEMTELQGQFPGQDRKVLTNSLNRLVNQGYIIKRPSKINPRFKVYGTERTGGSESSPEGGHSPSYSCVNSDDSNPEIITTQGLDDVTIKSPSMSPSSHHDVTKKNDDDSMMTPKTIENKGFKAPSHQVTIKSSLGGECVPPTNDDQDSVLAQNCDRADNSLQWDDLITEIDLLLKKLNWTPDKGKNYLLNKYGFKSRHQLSDVQVIEFLNDLKVMATDHW
jgi:hypothetical protein